MLFLALFVIIFLDFIFLPSFFGFFESSLTSLFLISTIFYFGINKKTISYVFLSAILIEIVVSYSSGTYVLSFILIIAFLFLISKIFNINPVKNSTNIYNYVRTSFAVVLMNYLLSQFFSLISGYTEGHWVFSQKNLIDSLSLVHTAEAFMLLSCLNLIKNIKFR